jgi:hypothetical protein
MAREAKKRSNRGTGARAARRSRVRTAPGRTSSRRGTPTARANAPLTLPELDARPIGRIDGWWALGVGAVAAAVFASTFASYVAPGDAPESVAGVESLGIVHAPGYPAYVLAARAFADVVPVGSITFRVQLFGLVCAAIAVGGMFLVGRCYRASRPGAAVGALSIATAASFWFNSSFAKHYSFSTALLVAAALLAIAWEMHGRPWALVGAAAALGVGLGAAWQLAGIMLASLVVLVLTGSRRPSRALAAGALAVMAAVAVALYAFVLVRAGQDPAVNWGEARTPEALVRLVTQRDFAPKYAQVEITNPVARIGVRIASYPAIIARDVGLGAALLALAGGIVAWRRFTRGHRWFLATLVGLNLASVMVVVPIDHIMGFRSSIFAGGFLLGLMVVLAVLIGVGVTVAVRLVAELAVPAHAVPPRGVTFAVTATIAVFAIVPSLVFHYTPANHRIAELVDDYTSRVLESLPPESVLIVHTSDMVFPYDYRQVVKDQRRDVAVVNLDNFGYPWYDAQTERRLGVDVPTEGGALERGLAVIETVRGRRPLYLDPGAMQVLQEHVGYRLEGLVGKVVGGTGPQPVANLAAASRMLDEIDRADDVVGHKYVRWLNNTMLFMRARVHVEVAKAYVLASDSAAATRELERAVAIYPDDDRMTKIMLFMQQRGTGAEDVIRHM